MGSSGPVVPSLCFGQEASGQMAGAVARGGYGDPYTAGGILRSQYGSGQYSTAQFGESTGRFGNASSSLYGNNSACERPMYGGNSFNTASLPTYTGGVPAAPGVQLPYNSSATQNYRNAKTAAGGASSGSYVAPPAGGDCGCSTAFTAGWGQSPKVNYSSLSANNGAGVASSDSGWKRGASSGSYVPPPASATGSGSWVPPAASGTGSVGGSNVTTMLYGGSGCGAMSGAGRSGSFVPPPALVVASGAYGGGMCTPPFGGVPRIGSFVPPMSDYPAVQTQPMACNNSFVAFTAQPMVRNDSFTPQPDFGGRSSSFGGCGYALSNSVVPMQSAMNGPFVFTADPPQQPQQPPMYGVMRPPEAVGFQKPGTGAAGVGQKPSAGAVAGHATPPVAPLPVNGKIGNASGIGNKPTPIPAKAAKKKPKGLGCFC